MLREKFEFSAFFVRFQMEMDKKLVEFASDSIIA